MNKNRNRNCIFILAFNLVMCAITSEAQTGIEKKTIATLGPGETLASGENCFLLDKNPETFSFVTVVGSGSSKQYYYYDKEGEKTGPVLKPDESFWAEGRDIETEDCIPNDEPRLGDLQESIDWATGSLKFQGKSHGPYGQVMMMYLSEDGQNFYAVALSQEMKVFFFDKNDRKVELVNAPEEIIISPDGSKAYAKVKGTINPFEPGAVEKMMNNPEEMNNPPINLYCIDGTKVGPFYSDGYGDAWFIAPAKLVVYNNHEISIDGKLLFKSDDYISPCDMWISSNGKDYAWANYENIFFGDGTKYVAPLVINYVVSGGKGYLKWIALEEGKNLMFYKKPF